MGILKLHRVAVIDGGQDGYHRGGTVLDLFGHLNGAAGLVGVVLVRQLAPLHIAVADQILVNGLRQITGNFDGFPVGISEHLVHEQLHIHFLGTVSQGLSQSGLECLGKFSEGHIGDQGQLVQLLYLTAQYALIHPLALLIDTQAQTTPDLLAAADLRLALGLQSADLEHIGVVPALPEGGVGEDEPHRLIQAEQPLLVLHNEVVGIGVIGGLGFAVYLALHEAGLLALFLVDGKVALMCLVGGDFVQVAEIGFVADLPLELAHHSFILFLKHPGILAVAPVVVISVVQAVLGHFINEEQAEHFNAFGVKLPLPANVGTDGLPDLDPPLEGGHLLVALDLSGIEFQAIEESD